MLSPRHTKRQHVNHTRGKQGIEIVRQRLPPQWIVRELNPDYGLDIHVEVFDLLPDGSGSSDTLGEHFYAQVKGVSTVKTIVKTVLPRGNVAKADPDPATGDEVDIEVVAFSLDTNELLTVESMGAAVPAVLFVVALDTGTVYFVCLNDYLSKVLLPDDPDYADQASHTIYLPVRNVLDANDDGFAYMWLLARRGKFYAAFNNFAYQRVEMEYAVAEYGALTVTRDEESAQIAPEIARMLQVFIRGNLRLDIWEHPGRESWPPLDDVRKGFESVLERLSTFSGPRSIDDARRFAFEVDVVLGRAANLGRMYEELVREWRLPTALASLVDDTAASAYRVVDHGRSRSAVVVAGPDGETETTG